MKIYKEALKACESGEPKDFPLGEATLRRSKNALAKKLKVSKLSWRKVRRMLDTTPLSIRS
jgi:hypothetical protein